MTRLIVFVEQNFHISFFICNAVDCSLIRFYAFKNWPIEPMNTMIFHSIGLFHFMGKIFFGHEYNSFFNPFEKFAVFNQLGYFDYMRSVQQLWPISLTLKYERP